MQKGPMMTIAGLAYISMNTNKISNGGLTFDNKFGRIIGNFQKEHGIIICYFGNWNYL